MMPSFLRLFSLLVIATLLAGCGAGRTYGRGESAARAGDWDAAVEHFRRAVQEDPDREDFRIALERAMITASVLHLDQARLLEARGQLEESIREYRRASEFDPSNRQIANRVLEIERRLRDLAEAARPQPNIRQLQEAARQSPEPLLNPASREPIDVVFNNASLRDILNSMGMSTGINVTFERDYQDRVYSVQLRGITFEQALAQILSGNQLFFKVVNERSIMVIPDTVQKRALYEEQVIRTFFVSHSDATELAQILNGVVRIPALAVAPQIVANKTNNTITVRASANIVQIIERVIEQNDNPKAEVVIDVQILEVNRGRAKQFGIELTDYSVGLSFSPEADPRGTGDSAGTLTPQPFNLNTVTRGISTADFYLSVPAAVVNFLESDSETRLIAKPQLRGAEGQQIRLNLGDQIPVPATVFTPVAGGGANFNPLTSFNYKDVGVNVEVTPRVTFEGDVILDLLVENSTLGGDINIAGQNLPSFGSRRVQTRLRLRDGESNLLAGLLREEERRSMRGIPGLLRLPILRNLFAANETDIRQTDIVMLLTPRIVRTQELTVQDVSPIFIGSQQSLGLGGPPPLIAPTADPDPAPAPATAAIPAPPAPAGTGVVVVPPGSSPVPGTTAVQSAAGVPVPPVAAGGRIMLSTPGEDFRVGGGPYTVAVSVTEASQVSSVSLTISFNPSVLRVRTVQEGSFLRAGGVAATFTQQVDPTTGRVDIAIVRSSDPTGVAGTGLLAAILFDAVGGGSANLALTGAATGPRGASVPLQIGAVPAVTVK
jgi:type II secretory pathway component GspD/PulD (secretin)